MLKHQEIISKLTTKEKVALLTTLEAYTQPSINEKGVPKVTFSRFSGEYPTATELSATFDAKLIREIAEKEIAGKKGGVIFLPESNARSLTADKGLSEDPYWNTEITKIYADVAKENGVVPVFSYFSVREEDKALSDADKRAVADYFLRPFRLAESAQAVVLKGDIDADEYASLLYKDTSEVFLIDEEAEDRQAFSLFDRGRVICLNAYSSLEKAIADYENMTNLLNKGRVSAGELREAEQSMEIISFEKLDEWTDRAIEFAFLCEGEETLDEIVEKVEADEEETVDEIIEETEEDKSETENSSEESQTEEEETETSLSDVDEKLSFVAAQKSIVLLKNDKVLPLESDKISIMGSVSEKTVEAFLSVYETVPVEADGTVVYFLPNVVSDDMVDTLMELQSSNNRVIAVLPSEYRGSVGFDKYTNALLLVPTHGNWADALVEILCGKVSPSGKLPVSLYANADERLEEIRSFRASGGETGPFIGYRRDEGEGKIPRYPFGFGLTYTSFSYSSLRISEQTISFTVENTGRMDGEETVQVYVGMAKSAIVRPDKELKAVQKVFLKAREKKQISIKIDTDDLSVYENEYEWATEKGSYQVYVGGSLSGIKLKGNMNVPGTVFQAENAPRYKYLPGVGNTVEEGYTFEGKKKKKGKVVGLLASIATALVGAGLLVSGIVSDAYMERRIGFVLLVLGVLVGAVFAVITFRKRKNVGKKAEKEDTPVRDWDELFNAAFSDGTEKDDGKRVTKKGRVDDGFLDEVDISVLCRRIVDYCAEHCMEVSADDVAELLAAMTLSRLIVMKKTDKVEAFLTAVAKCLNGSTLFASFPTEIKKKAEELMKMMQSQKVSFMALSFEKEGRAKETFRMIFHIPEGQNKVVLNDKEGKPIMETDALWIVVLVDPDEDVLPLLSGVSAFVSPTVKDCDRRECNAEKVDLNVKEFQKTTEDLCQNYALDESQWKRIDQFEEYAKSLTEYGLDNKVNRALERYMAVRLLCGTAQADLPDDLLAHVLLPKFLAGFDRGERPEEQSVKQAVERILGEDNIVETAKTLTYFLHKNKEA